MMSNTSALVLNHDGDQQKAILYSLGALLLIFINSMTIVSYLMRKKGKRGIPDIFMLSLAISSILTMATVILILAYVRATGNENFTGLMSLCYTQVFFGTMLRLLDVTITTAITIDRFLALYKPLVYRVKINLKHGKIICIILWLSSGIISTLPFLGFGRISMHMQSFCTADWTSDIAYIVLAMAYAQFAIVLLCYVGIFRATSGLVSRQKTMKKSQSLSYVSPLPTRKKGIANEITMSSTILESISEKRVSGLDNFAFEGQSPSTSSLDFIVTPNNEESKLVKDFTENFPDTKRRVSMEETSLDIKEGETPTKGRTFTSETTHDRPVSKSDYSKPPFKENIKKKNNRVSWLNTAESESCDSRGNDSITQAADKPKLAKTHSSPLPHRDKPDQPSFTRAISDYTISQKAKKRFSSFNILRHLSKRNRNRTSNASLKDFRTESQRFAKIMGVVVCLFYISWLPLAISINIVLVSGLEYFIKNYYNILWLSYNLSLTSSIAIPIAYAVMCKPYRASYKALWKFVKNRFVWKGEIKLA
ncbi:alpha-2B adrenergic receptor-like [Clytia hemisphaerica]|uniref:G-protein coupled receptors family 1 profile domain-containing protein n=1 Tax=Clytia hemisphaerica TaxID=252671 RepID=A0A7M5V720_9CNID